MPDVDLEAIKARIQERIGAASMCWEPIPSGVFLSTAALMIADNLMATVVDWIGNARAPLVAEVERLRDALIDAVSDDGECPQCAGYGPTPSDHDERCWIGATLMAEARRALHPQEPSDE